NQTQTTVGDNYNNLSPVPESEANTKTTMNNNGYNFGGNFLYRHKFHKKGRTISWNVSPGINNKTGTSTLYSIQSPGDTTITDQRANQNTKSYSLSSNIAYSEPIGKSSQLLVSYNTSYANNNTDKETFNFTPADN